jgi:hypothetical protein
VISNISKKKTFDTIIVFSTSKPFNTYCCADVLIFSSSSIPTFQRNIPPLSALKLECFSDIKILTFVIAMGCVLLGDDNRIFKYSFYEFCALDELQHRPCFLVNCMGSEMTSPIFSVLVSVSCWRDFCGTFTC